MEFFKERKKAVIATAAVAVLAMLVIALLGYCGHIRKRTFTIAFTSNSNGYISQHEDTLGLAKVASFIRDLRAMQGEVPLLDTGNSLYGSMLARTTKGRGIIEAMNEVGYSAATVGPTDFLLGAGVIKDLSSQANFRILCAGSYYEGEQKREFLSPYTTITIDGSRIGFLALTNPDLYNQVAEGNFADVYFADMLKTARQKVDELLPKVEMVVVYGNLGQDMAKRLAEEIPELSLIIDGAPTSAAGGYMHNGIPVVTTRNGLAAVGVVEVTVSHGKVQSYHFEMYDSQRLESYAPDERVQAKLESLGAQLEMDSQNLLLNNNYLLEGSLETVGTRASNLGNVACDALLWKTKADFALLSANAFLQDIPMGDVSRQNLYAAFAQTRVCTVRLSGAQIKSMLECALYDLPEPTPYFLQIGGFRIGYCSENPPGQRVVSMSVDDRCVALDQTYLVAVNENYLNDEYIRAAFGALKTQTRENYLADMVYDYLRMDPQGIASSDMRLIPVPQAKNQ